MAETPTQTARRRQEERRSFSVRGAKPIVAAQEGALRRGYTSTPMPEQKVRPARAPGEPMAPRQEPVSADVLGGAADDPSLEIVVGPTGEITRRRRKE